eukprot:743312-Rhodomonas_salina.1
MVSPDTAIPSPEAQAAPATHSTPERKRRKGVPMHNSRSPSSASKSRPRSNSSRAQLQSPALAGEESGAWKQEDVEAGNASQAAPEGMPINIWSDISESVLSDPQVSPLCHSNIKLLRFSSFAAVHVGRAM